MIVVDPCWNLQTSSSPQGSEEDVDLETHGFNGGELVVGTGWQEVQFGSLEQ